MMKTPICDFINDYIKSDKMRLHMPGHKGKDFLGFEKFDITEFSGADCLYHADGIIKESENNATSLFGSGGTFYSCEGSSLSIRAMLYLAYLYSNDKDGYVLAGRNAHSSFISASGLIGFDVKWIFPCEDESYLSCKITPTKLENILASVDKKPFAVYITSPDYLGNITDIEGLSKVCHKHNILLLVDNAHGAYLKFLDKSMHPIDLGADMCCDSAHKTLPVLTGGAYLHISKNAPSFFAEQVKNALSLFGSTSPSYLILASLDNANNYISSNYKSNLCEFINRVDDLKKRLNLCGFTLLGDEKLKITIDTRLYGYSGFDLAQYLEKNNIIVEFCDPDFVVLMLSCENDDLTLEKIYDVLKSLPKKNALEKVNIKLTVPKVKMSIKTAMFKKKKLVNIDTSLGKTLASTNVTCPPAVSIIVCGEEINQSVIDLSKHYGITECYIVE